jgi:hypothetical protein
MESQPDDRFSLQQVLVDGKTSMTREKFETVVHHVLLLESGGYIHQPQRHYYGMTWEGHEFLDKVRDPEIWRKTKAGATKLNTWSVKLLGELATGYIKAKAVELGLPPF